MKYKKFIKYFLCVFLIFLLLLFFVGNAILDKYNGQIEGYLSEQIGKDIKVDSVSFNTYPFFSLKFENLNFDNGRVRIPRSIIYLSPLNMKLWRANFYKPQITLKKEKDKELENKFEYSKDSYNYDTYESLVNFVPRFNFFNFSFDNLLGDLSLDYFSSFKKLVVKDARIVELDEKGQGYTLDSINLVLKKNKKSLYLDLDGDVQEILEQKKNLKKKDLKKKSSKGKLRTKLYLDVKEVKVKNLVGDTYPAVTKQPLTKLVLRGEGSFNNESKNYKISNLNMSSLFSENGDILTYLGSNAKLAFNKFKDIEGSLFPFYSKKYPSLLIDIKTNSESSNALKDSDIEGIEVDGSIVEFRPDLKIWDTKIKLNKNVALDIGAIDSISNSSYQINSAKLSIPNCEANIEAKLDLKNEKYFLELGTNYINFKDVNRITNKYGVKLPNLELVGAIKAEFNKSKKKLESKNLILKNFDAYDIQSSFLEFEDLNLELDSNFNILNLKSNLKVEELKAAVEPRDKYGVGLLKGFIDLKSKNSNIEASGDLSISDFSFNDSFVDIRNMNAQAKDLKSTYSVKNGLSINLNLFGEQIYLNVPDYELKSIESLNGPVTLEIDTEGKYRVYGVGSGQNALMRYLDKDFNVNGLISFDVSKKLKTFSSDSLTGELNTKNYNIQDVNFEITKDFYNLKQANLSIFSGQGNLRGKWGRKIEPFELELKLNHLSLNEFDQILSKKKDLSGSIEVLNIQLEGNKSDPKSFNGNGSIKFKKGTLKSLELDTILSNPSKQQVVLEDDPGTYVESLEFESLINQGVLQTDDLILAGEFYTFKGKGMYSLEQGFDVKGSAVYLEKTLSELGGPIKFLRKLIGSIGKVEIPVKIKGKAQDPEVEADLANILRVLSPGRAVENIGKGVEEMFDGIKDAVSGK